MERSTWIGIAAVAVLGVGGALVAFVAIAPTPTPTEPVVVPPTSPDAAQRSPAPASPIRAPEPTPDDTRVRADRSVRPETRSDRRPPPPPSGPLEETFLRGEELLMRPIAAELPPDASEAEIVEAVSDRIAAVEEVIAEYRELARTDSDPVVRSEALQRGAVLYDRLAEQVPTAPPPYVDEAGMDAWVQRNEEMMRNLHGKAEALRQDAALTLDDE